MTADSELATSMKSHAEICVRNAARQDWQLDYSSRTLPVLEEVIDSLTPWRAASPEVRDGMITIIGAYFGEVLARSLDGTWLVDPTYDTPAVSIGGANHFPHSMVRKRWEKGRKEGLAFKFQVISEGPFESTPRKRRWRR